MMEKGREEGKDMNERRRGKTDDLDKHTMCLPHPTFSLLGMWYHYDGVLNLSGQHYVPTTQCEDCSPTLGGTLKET